MIQLLPDRPIIIPPQQFADISGLGVALDISQHLDPAIELIVSMESSEDGGATWLAAGGFTRFGGKGVSLLGNDINFAVTRGSQQEGMYSLDSQKTWRPLEGLSVADIKQLGLQNAIPGMRSVVLKAPLIRLTLLAKGGAVDTSYEFLADQAQDVPPTKTGDHFSIAVVKSCKQTTSSATSITATFSGSTTSGNLIIVDNVYYKTLASFSTQTDSKSNTYSNAIAEIAVVGANTINGQEWYNDNVTGGASHGIILTMTGNTLCTMTATEISGQTVGAAKDKTVSTQVASGTSYTSANTTTTAQNNELLHGFGFTNDNFASTLSSTTPWSTDQTYANGAGQIGIISSSQGVTATGTYAFTFAQNGTADTGVACISTWMEAAAGGAVTPWAYRFSRVLGVGPNVS